MVLLNKEISLCSQPLPVIPYPAYFPVCIIYRCTNCHWLNILEKVTKFHKIQRESFILFFLTDDFSSPWLQKAPLVAFCK